MIDEPRLRVRLLGAADIRRVVPMRRAIEVTRQAFAALSAGRAHVPARTPVEVPPDAVALFMPGYLEGFPAGLGVKFVSVFPANRGRGLPLIHALVVLADPEAGRPLGVLEGTFLTAWRTGAATGVATDLLARRDARVLALIGAGAQAEAQVLGVCEVRPIEEVRVYSRTRPRAEALAEHLRTIGVPVPPAIQVVDSPAEAVRGADIVVTATTSPVPVFSDADLMPGAHVNAIGAFTPETRELETATIRRAKVVVDSRVAALSEAGDILIPIREGAVSEDQIYAELGEVVLGKKPGRTDPEEITVFKSVGNAAQDVAVGGLALVEAERLGLGVQVEL
jgi:ornithine cyclodeaminase/alanine dehydrogenase-like protein (mu-crystallin family)